MSRPRPSFLDSPYFVDDVDNWHLKEGAPKEMVDEFNLWMKNEDLIIVSSKKEYERILKGNSGERK